MEAVLWRRLVEIVEWKRSPRGDDSSVSSSWGVGGGCVVVVVVEDRWRMMVWVWGVVVCRVVLSALWVARADLVKRGRLDDINFVALIIVDSVFLTSILSFPDSSNK